jgi:antitoxin component of MazEF toxin-antitoxin module
MPIVATRRVIQVGHSKAVSLLPGWLEAANLQLGDSVLVIADGVVLIVPQGLKLQRSDVETLVEVANRKNTKLLREAAIRT